LIADGIDEHCMRLALRLALRGAGRTSPNPMVGAVVARGGKIIATGYHRQAGKDHAEIDALKRAGSKARGATLYLNLEPCDHYGKTPPCTLSLIQAGVERVVAGMVDPNPLVSGRGIRRLRRAGIRVDVGLLEKECRTLNEAFVKYARRGLPFVFLKLALTLDGRIATATGDSRWITGPSSRAYVHRLRNQSDAVVVGVGTVLADDPRLTCRAPGGRDPWRIVLDGHLRIPLSARLLRERNPEKTIVVTGPGALERKIEAIREKGAEVWSLPLRKNRVPFRALLRRLARMGVLTVMIEGGAETAACAMRERAVDKVSFFYAPKLVGGDGRPAIEALGIDRMSRSRAFEDVSIRRFGDDFLITAYPKAGAGSASKARRSGA
jgi:diaminohydroxyphosphoribosylaminopyrimidine deaminase/5-amino-6-(5-phosphoribosylamino)uracil reductase